MQGLRAKGLRVDGLGEQGHWGLDDPPLPAIDEALAAIRASGTKALVTELDLDVLPRDPDMWGADLAKKATIRAATNVYPDGLPPAVQQQLARRYADVFTLFLKHDVGRVTFWGVTDATTWLDDFPIPGRVNYPLLWDRDGHEKPAFEAVAEVLRERSVEESTADQVKTASGLVQAAPDSTSDLRVFRRIPLAEPPVGDLRWKAPQPVKSWPGVRPADKFGPRCMQRAMFNDMEFRSNGMGEDCLYLNVWTPARSGKERLPVLVYFYGGGYRAGDGSEPRYDGASMAGKGIVALTVNYRLGVFGFLAHPELSQEAPYHASGNYGLLDQNAALRWVQANIAAFGATRRG